MPYCARCGAELRPNARLYHKCGASVTPAIATTAKPKAGPRSGLGQWISLCARLVNPVTLFGFS